MKHLFLSLFMMSSLISFTPKVEAIDYKLLADSALLGFMGGAAAAAITNLLIHGSKTYNTPAEKRQYEETKKTIIAPIFWLSVGALTMASYKNNWKGVAALR